MLCYAVHAMLCMLCAGGGGGGAGAGRRGGGRHGDAAGAMAVFWLPLCARVVCDAMLNFQDTVLMLEAAVAALLAVQGHDKAAPIAQHSISIA